jgi:hypothetical protein
MANNKRLLILTDALPPSFAPRMSYLINQLSNKGYEVTAFAIQQPQTNCNLPTGNAAVHNLVYKQRFLQLVGEVLFNYKNKWFYKAISKAIKGQNFDTVLCSTYETFPLPAALKIAKKLNVPLIADLRDITEQFGNNYFKNRHPKAPWLGKWFADIKIRQRNKVLKQAQAVTSVSPWHRDFLKKWNSQVHLIYNGYDKELFYPQLKNNTYFDIVYTGRIIDTQQRNPTLLFAALQELMEQKQICPCFVRMLWYTDEESKAAILDAIQPYPQLTTLMRFCQIIPAKEVPQLLWDSSVVLVLSNKACKNGPQGIMTTKFFEALGVEKPVLCVRSDEACLANTIAQTNAGLAATNVEEVKAFLLDTYAQWKQNGYTHQAVNPAMKERFSRQAMVQQFEEIILSVIK